MKEKAIFYSQRKNIDLDDGKNDNSNSKRAKSFLIKTFEKFFLNEDDNQEEENIIEPYQSNLVEKKRSILRNMISLNKRKEWNFFTKNFKEQEKKKQSSLYLFKSIFNINSDFVIIWKMTFAIFYIFFVFLYFFKYFFLELSVKSDNEKDKKILYLYYIINYMFFLEFLISLLILIFSNGSLLSKIKIPLKLYCAIPFPLNKKYLYYILPKFIRIDIFDKPFDKLESFINIVINNYIQNYYSKIFLTYTNHMTKYLIIFLLYAHCTGCVLAYFQVNNDDELKGFYHSALYYTLETFTTIGFGDFGPSNDKARITCIINLFIGVNLFSLITSNINYLNVKITTFNRSTNFVQLFENFLFEIQYSTGKVLHLDYEKIIYKELCFRNKYNFNDILNKYPDIFKLIKYNLKENVRETIFDNLKLEYYIFFKDFNDDSFMYEIFEKLNPIIYNKNSEIISYGEKLDKLYFLYSGEIFIFKGNYKNYLLYEYNQSTIFGDYEFLFEINCDYSVRNHLKRQCFCFYLNRKDWNDIIKNHILSVKKFINNSVKKKLFQNSKFNILDDKNKNVYEKNQFIKIVNPFSIKENKYNNLKNKINNICNKIDLLKKNIIEKENKLIILKSQIIKNIQ